MSDSITVLRSCGRRLAKFVRADGAIVGYDSAKTFHMAEMRIDDLDHLQRLLQRLLRRPDCCIVRGVLADPERTSRVRRLYLPDPESGDAPTIRDASHHWIALDVDGVARPDNVDPADLAACAKLALALLPGEFRGARHIVQASAGHGLKPGCRLRLWFWASRPVSQAELNYWVRCSPVDTSLFRPAQVTYTAAPIFESGNDHLPQRIMDLAGAPTVHVPPPEDLRPPPCREPPPSKRQQRDTPVERLIAKVLVRVESARDGERHERLRAAARTIGGVLAQAGITEAEATGQLLAAVKRAGGAAVDERNAAGTIAWGLAKGKQAPLALGAPHA